MASLTVGLKVATLLKSVTDPATFPDGPETLKVPVFTVDAVIGSLKIAATFFVIETPVCKSAGSVELTVGAVESPVAPVVNDQT